MNLEITDDWSGTTIEVSCSPEVAAVLAETLPRRVASNFTDLHERFDGRFLPDQRIVWELYPLPEPEQEWRENGFHFAHFLGSQEPWPGGPSALIVDGVCQTCGNRVLEFGVFCLVCVKSNPEIGPPSWLDRDKMVRHSYTANDGLKGGRA